MPLIIAVWIAGMLLVGWMAQKRNRSPVGWILLSLVITPLLAFVLVFVMAPGEDPDADIHAIRQSRLFKAKPDIDPLQRAKREQEAEIAALQQKKN